MAVDRKGKSITMTADADAYTGVVFVSGITFQGSSLSAGERLRLTDTSGDVVADYLVAAATDNADLWNGRGEQFFHGLLLEDGPASGTWVLTVFLA